MTWTLHRPQQQRGAQLHARPGEAPREATADRAAQDHEQAGAQPRPEAGYPASRLEDRAGEDNTPTAPDRESEGEAEWDKVVQPERAPRAGRSDDLPLPEGK